MSRRTCPACTRRYAGLVDPDCVICWGLGVVGLGAAALHRNEPAVVARAIELYLEAAASNAAQRLPIGEPRREALAAAAAELRIAGVIADTIAHGTPANERPDSPEGPARRITDSEAYRLAFQHGAWPTSPADAANLDADPVVYGVDDRPLVHSLPVVSAAGSPSFLARAADPADPLGDTRAQAYERGAVERRAAVMAAAVPRATEIRARRTSTPADPPMPGY